MRESLTILAAGERLGQVTRRGDRLWFRYESAWQESSDAFQLSVSMPLATGGHPHGRIDPFLRGLLPDNPRVLEQWARRRRLSAATGRVVPEN